MAISLDPGILYQQYEARHLTSTKNLKYCKTFTAFKKILTDLSTNNPYLIANIFQIRKDSSTNFIMRRTQCSHIVSQPLLNYLGYSMKEFQDAFITYGFPKIYNNITDIEEILRMQKRDIFINKKVQNQNIDQNSAKKIPVLFKRKKN